MSLGEVVWWFFYLLWDQSIRILYLNYSKHQHSTTFNHNQNTEYRIANSLLWLGKCQTFLASFPEPELFDEGLQVW